MATTLEYWFAHGNGDNYEVGHIYKSDKLGRVIVFDGNIRVGNKFIIHDSKGRNVEGEEKEALLEVLLSMVVESVKDA